MRKRRIYLSLQHIQYARRRKVSHGCVSEVCFETPHLCHTEMRCLLIYVMRDLLPAKSVLVKEISKRDRVDVTRNLLNAA